MRRTFSKEIGDFPEHRLHGARLLTDGDHLHHHAGKYARLRERLGDGLPLCDGRLHLEERLFDDHVSGGLRDDFQAVQNWNAARDHGSERSREARDGDLSEQVAEDRDPQRQGIRSTAERQAPTSRLEEREEEEERGGKKRHGGRRNGENQHHHNTIIIIIIIII